MKNENSQFLVEIFYFKINNGTQASSSEAGKYLRFIF